MFLRNIRRYRDEEDGAVSVDWVVLTAAIVVLGVAVIGSVQQATVTLGDRISSEVDGILP